VERTKFQTNNHLIELDLLLTNTSTGLMAFECNIDQRGIRFRRRLGNILLGIGFIIGVSFFLIDINHFLKWEIAIFLWLLPAGLIAGGAFSLFEARMGWCAARALGIRTKI